MPTAPNPGLIFEALNAYQRSYALKAGIELEVFTRIAEGAGSPEELAARTHVSSRGLRILCDFLVIQGFLQKSEGRYQLTPDSAVFLDKRSPAYMGGVSAFLCGQTLVGMGETMTSAIRKGGTVMGEAGTMDVEHPVWIDFARAMVPMAMPNAKAVAELLVERGKPVCRVLDIAAGHGMYGITVAQRMEGARVTALDWPPVLAVAKEHAGQAGVADRFETMGGSVFDLDLGKGWDVVLVPNFYHHFDIPACTRLAHRIHESLAEGGCMVTVEFVPNEDRVTPAMHGAFAMIMLVSTAHGDAYTFREFERMFKDAGFSQNTLHETAVQRLIVSEK